MLKQAEPSVSPNAGNHSAHRPTEIQKFLQRLRGFVAVQASLSLFLVIAYAKTWNHAIGEGYKAATIDKHCLLQQQPSPRIIFVGGSSTAFGIDSHYVKQKLKYNSVNMGLNAGSGAE